MKKFVVIFCALFMVTAFASTSFGQQVNNLNEPGSVLVYPYMNNAAGYHTIIEIANRANTGVWLEGYVIAHPPGAPTAFEKIDFYIHLTQKEPFWWDTFNSYNRTDADGIRTSIPGFSGYVGFIVVWAIDSDKTQLEIDWDYLKGDALLYNSGLARAFQYNAIPHQGIAVVGDRTLNLNGLEYTRATSQIMFEGFAEGFSGITGALVVASPNINFITSVQPKFDINFECWNQYENGGTRHKSFTQFAVYDLTTDLRLSLAEVVTPKFQCATSATQPLWAIFYEATGSLAWGCNVFQHPAMGSNATLVLPPVPVAAE